MICSQRKALCSATFVKNASRVRVTTLLDIKGDKCSLEVLLTNEANEECAKYLESPRSILNTDLRFITGGSTYLVDLQLHVLTYRD